MYGYGFLSFMQLFCTNQQVNHVVHESNIDSIDWLDIFQIVFSLKSMWSGDCNMDIKKNILLEIELHYGIFSGFKETYLIPRDQQRVFSKELVLYFFPHAMKYKWSHPTLFILSMYFKASLTGSVRIWSQHFFLTSLPLTIL